MSEGDERVQAAMPEMMERTTGPGRRLAYRIVAAVFGLAVVGLSLPFTVTSFIDEEQAIHRMHNTSTLIGFGGLVGVLLIVSAWRPEANIAAIHVVAAAALAGLATGLMSGDLIGGGWLVAPIVVLVVWTLHPSRTELFRLRGPNLPLVVVSLLAVVPGIAWALTQAELQRNGVTALDPHAEFHHYSGMAAAGLTIPLVGVAAAFPARGARLARWFVGGCVTALGIASLALSEEAGAFDTPWAWALLGGGVLYVVLSEVTGRKAPA